MEQVKHCEYFGCTVYLSIFLTAYLVLGLQGGWGMSTGILLYLSKSDAI